MVVVRSFGEVHWPRLREVFSLTAIPGDCPWVRQTGPAGGDLGRTPFPKTP